MTIAVVSVWRQQEDLLIPRMETLSMAEFERRKGLPSEYSHGGTHDGEWELVPHAEILSTMTYRRPTAQGRSVISGSN